MAVLGLIIAALAAAFGVGVILGNTATLDEFQVFEVELAGINGAGVFLLGAATLLALILGLWLLAGGAKRARRRRQEARELRRERDATAQRLEQERAKAAEERARIAEEREALAARARPAGDYPRDDRGDGGNHADGRPVAPDDANRIGQHGRQPDDERRA